MVIFRFISPPNLAAVDFIQTTLREHKNKQRVTIWICLPENKTLIWNLESLRRLWRTFLDMFPIEFDDIAFYISDSITPQQLKKSKVFVQQGVTGIIPRKSIVFELF